MVKMKVTVAAAKAGRRPLVAKFEAKSVSEGEARVLALGEKILRLKFWNGQKWQKAY